MNAPATADRATIRVRWFDADSRDRDLSFDEAIRVEVGDRELVWIDVEGDLEPEQQQALAARLQIDRETAAALIGTHRSAALRVHGSYLHVRVVAEPSDQRPFDRAYLDILSARDIVVTRHPTALGFLDDVNDRMHRDAQVGAITGPLFVALLLDEVVTTYFRAVDAVEDDIDMLDTRSLRDQRTASLLDDLVGVRRRITALRRLLTDHRAVFAALGAPDVAETVDPDAAQRFRDCADRYVASLTAVENAREALRGSFDVYMTRTAQRTNEIMKVLTVTSVLLLPGSLIAGLLGMNVEVPLGSKDPLAFWLVIGAIGLVATTLLIVARVRRWI